MLEKTNWFKNQKRLAMTILIIGGGVVYFNALFGQLFWDDYDGIVNNIYIKDWSYWRHYFTDNLIAGAGLQSNYWRPMLLLIFSLGWKIWGLWPVGFHLINIVIHILAGGLLFQLLYLLTKKTWLAFFSTLFFIVHPLQTEAVSYVSGLADPLSVVFIFSGLLVHLKNRHKQSSWLVAIFFILALMTKEKSVLLFPALLSLLETSLFFQENIQEISFRKIQIFLKKLFLRYWPLLAIGVFYLLLRATSLNFQNTFNLYDSPNLYADHLSIRIWTFFKIFPQYLGLIFWPFNLHMERLVAIEQSPFSLPVLVGLIFLSLIFIRLFFLIKSHPLAFFGLSWFLFALLASSGIPAVSAGIMYEHYLYLPLGGFFFWLALEIENLILKNHFGNQAKRIGFIFLFFYTLFLGFLTIQRNRVWKTPIALYENILKYNQTSLRVWNNLGMAYADIGQTEKAILAYQKAIELDPEKQSLPPRHNLANALVEMGKKKEAKKLYQEILLTDPKFIFSYTPLLKILIEEKEFSSGINFFQILRQKAPEKHWEIDAIIEELRQREKISHE